MLKSCIDPASGVGMKIWQCYANLPAQQWFYTDDNRIAVEGKGTSEIHFHSRSLSTSSKF